MSAMNQRISTPDELPRPAGTGRSLPIALLRTREKVMERFRPMLAALDVTEQQWRVLRVLGEGGRMEAGVVAERACVLPPSLSRIIKTLEANGQIGSTRDKSDGRRTMLALTSRGRAFLNGAAPESVAISAGIERSFGKPQMAELLDLLERLQQALAATDT